MIKLPFDGKMILDAKQKADKLGNIRNSITNGFGNLAGYLGEEAIALHLGADNISCDEGKDKYNHDLIFNGLKLEVKTKRRSVKPLPNYDVSINGASKHQKPDIYIFISIECNEIVSRNPTIYKGIKNIWLCGFMGYDEYFYKAKYYNAGDKDFYGFRFTKSAYNVSISELHINIADCLSF